MLNQLFSLWGKINEALAIGNANISWENKYRVLLEQYNKSLRFAPKDVGLTLFWHNPDTSYKAAVAAYLTSVSDLGKTVDALISAIEENNGR